MQGDNILEVGDIFSEKSDKEITAQTNRTSGCISTRNRAGKEALVVFFYRVIVSDSFRHVTAAHFLQLKRLNGFTSGICISTCQF